ncbi:FAD-dependent oxidoreductase [Salinispira pacifica]
MNDNSYDVAVLGAGIVGCMTARFLSAYDLSVVLIDRANDVGTGATCANSAILHSGHDPEPGTVKAFMNRRGNELWHRIGDELDVPRNWCGALIVAVGSGELAGLEPLLERGRANGIEGLRIIGREELLEREPGVNPDATGALFTPTAGVIDPFRAAIAAAENAVENGVTLMLDTEVTGVELQSTEHRETGTAPSGRSRLTTVHTTSGDVRARWFVNSLGVHADEFMHMAGDRPKFTIRPRRGEYFIFDAAKMKTNSVLFPMPSEKGKGILVTTTTHGNTLVGPNAQFIDDKEDTASTAAGMAEILSSAQRLVPGLDSRDIIGSFAGIRATGNYGRKDFLIEASAIVDGLINLGGIESPGFVASPAIAERVVEILREQGLSLVEKPDWKPYRRRAPAFKELSHEARARLIEQRPDYGRIVCRCENVTEGEIVDAVRSPVPATSYDAVKRRCWLGTGRCQGGFDYPRVIEILARELSVPVTEITKRGHGSELLYRETKVPEKAAVR